MTAKKSPQVLIFFTVFLYLVGFGLIIPILPTLGQELGGEAKKVGLLMAIYSAMQFVFAPLWGHMSDRKGRRPILVGCLLGEALTYVWFAFARDFWSLFAARALAGFFGASLSTASAYISDITPKEQRSKGMAIIGAAFGLGFVIGPALGGILLAVSKHYSNDPMAGSTFAGLFVSVLCIVTFVFAYFKLPESLPPEKRKSMDEKRENRAKLLVAKMKEPVLNALISTMFLNTLAMSVMEATLVLYLGARFGWSSEKVSYGFAYVGIIMVITQGGLVRRMMPKFGERNLAITGLVGLTIGMAGIGLSQSITHLAIAMTFLALGNGFANPSILGSISLVSSVDNQGVNMGVAQSASSLGRILGPLMGGYVYQVWMSQAPFALSSLIGFFGVGVLIYFYKNLPHAGAVKA